MSALTTNEPVMPSTGNAAPILDNKMSDPIDPSIGQAISHGNEMHSNGLTNGNAVTSEVSPLEKSPAMAPSAVDSNEIPTTTTTTIITTTTGPAANGSTIASPISPTSELAGGSAAPVTSAAPNGSAISPEAAAVGGVGAGAVGATALAAEKGKKEEEKEKKAKPPVSMTPKDAKKYNKLLKNEAKNEEKEIAAAIKTAQSNEKALRKAKKAEAQSGSRHDSAIKDDHNTSKSLNKAQLAHEKAVTALQKAEEELQIKKRHTATQSDAYDSIKKKIEVLRKNKLANEKDRNSRRVNVA